MKKKNLKSVLGTSIVATALIASVANATEVPNTSYSVEKTSKMLQIKVKNKTASIKTMSAGVKTETGC